MAPAQQVCMRAVGRLLLAANWLAGQPVGSRPIPRQIELRNEALAAEFKRRDDITAYRFGQSAGGTQVLADCSRQPQEVGACSRSRTRQYSGRSWLLSTGNRRPGSEMWQLGIRMTRVPRCVGRCDRCAGVHHEIRAEGIACGDAARSAFGERQPLIPTSSRHEATSSGIALPY